MKPVKTINDIKKLYEILKKARTILNWGEFSDKIKYDRTYISRVLNEHEPLTNEILEKINIAFDVTNIVVPGSLELHEPDIPLKKDTEQSNNNNTEDDLHTLIRSNLILVESRKTADEERLILAQTNAKLTDKLLTTIERPVMSEPEILQGLNASITGLLAAIVKVATGARFESAEAAESELGKIVRDKHRKPRVKNTLSACN